MAAVDLGRVLPPSIIVLGITVGALYALLAMGFVIIYKSTRILNMAHGDIGGFGAILLVWCVVQLHFGFWPAFAVAVSAGALVGAVVERGIVNRLRNAPRLVLLVVTLGLAQLITAVNNIIIPLQQRAQLTQGVFPEPFHASFTVLGATLRPASLLTLVLVPAIVLALVAFFRFHRFGLAMRAAAENADNAQLLGISAGVVSLAAWTMGGALSATAAVLYAGVSGTAVTLGIGPALLLRALAPAMAAGMTSLSRAAMWGLGIGVVDQVVGYNLHDGGAVDGLLLALVLVSLLVRRRTAGRAGDLEESSWPVASALRTLSREVLEGALNRRLRQAVAAAALAAAVIAPFVVSNAQSRVLVEVIAFGIGALSLTVLTGYGGQVSLGQWAIAGLSGFAAARLDVYAGWPAWATLCSAVVVGALAAGIVGLPALRLRGLFLAVTTLAFAVAGSDYLFQQGWLTGSRAGIQLYRQPNPLLDAAPIHLVGRTVDLTHEQRLYLVALVALMVAVLVVRQTARSRLGRAMGAVRENERAAAAMGLNVVAVKLTTFALSGALAGLAGWVFIYLSAASASSGTFTIQDSFKVVAIAVVGGVGTISGPLLGALLVVGVPKIFSGLDLLVTLGTYIGVLQILLHLPTGLVTLPLRLRDALLRGPEADVPETDDTADALVEQPVGAPRKPRQLASARP